MATIDRDYLVSACWAEKLLSVSPNESFIIVDTQSSFTKEQIYGAHKLLVGCGNFLVSEQTVIIFDTYTQQVAECISAVANDLGGKAHLVETCVASTHGEEPDEVASEAMRCADLVLGLRTKSIAHTNARMALTKRGGRYLSLPDYSLELLCDPCIGVDYQDHFKNVSKITTALSEGSKITVITIGGTNISMDATGREGNCCPGFVKNHGDLGSPPDIESNIAPLEHSANGTVVVDGSIPFPGFGLIESPVSLFIENGRIVNISGSKRHVSGLNTLFKSYGDQKSRVLAECGIGLNPEARLRGVMLTDEGCLGTAHFGFGSNHTIGGTNTVPFHIDFVCKAATIIVDDQVIIAEGQIKI